MKEKVLSAATLRETVLTNTLYVQALFYEFALENTFKLAHFKQLLNS